MLYSMLWQERLTNGEVGQVGQDGLQERQEGAVADYAQHKLKQLGDHGGEGEVVRILIHLENMHALITASLGLQQALRLTPA